MCLDLRTNHGYVVSYRKDSSFWKKLQKYGKVTCWKIYWKEDDHLESYWKYQKISSPRMVLSDRKTGTKLYDWEWENGIVNRGIHVYTRKQDYVSSECCQIPVVCQRKDFVAEGCDNEAVFTQVEITKRNWNKIFKKKI